MPFLDQQEGRPPLYSCGPDEPEEAVAAGIKAAWRQRDQGHDWVAVSVRGKNIEVAISAGGGKRIYATSRPLEIHTTQLGVDIRWGNAFWVEHKCETPLDARKIPEALRVAVVNWLKYGTPEPEKFAEDED